MPDVQNMEALENITTADISLPSYNNSVKIFKNTRAIDVPSKLNVLADSFKNFHESIRDTWQSYIESRFDVIHQHVNSSMEAVVSFINDSIVSAQNTFIEAANESVSELEESVDTFKSEIRNSVSELVGSDAAYTVANINDVLLSKDTSEDTYDQFNRILSVREGPMKISDISYDAYGRINKYTETLTLNDIPTSETYTITYEVGKIPKTTKEA